MKGWVYNVVSKRTYLISVVRVDNQSVQVGGLIELGGNVLLDEVVLAIDGEDNVDLASARPADIGSKHDVVRGFSVHRLLLQTTKRAIYLTYEHDAEQQ
jgi:hypothetical protein